MKHSVCTRGIALLLAVMMIIGMVPMYVFAEETEPTVTEPIVTEPVVLSDDGVTKYAVTFDSNGGTEVEPQEVVAGEKVIEPEDPTRDGYTFLGWFFTENEEEKEWDFETAVAGDLTLTAKWEEKTAPAGEPPVVEEDTTIYYDNTASLWDKVFVSWANPQTSADVVKELTDEDGDGIFEAKVYGQSPTVAFGPTEDVTAMLLRLNSITAGETYSYVPSGSDDATEPSEDPSEPSEEPSEPSEEPSAPVVAEDTTIYYDNTASLWDKVFVSWVNPETEAKVVKELTDEDGDGIFEAKVYGQSPCVEFGPHEEVMRLTLNSVTAGEVYKVTPPAVTADTTIYYDNTASKWEKVYVSWVNLQLQTNVTSEIFDADGDGIYEAQVYGKTPTVAFGPEEDVTKMPLWLNSITAGETYGYEPPEVYGDGYYKVITEKDYNLAPGIVETEMVLNNSAQSHRQVLHIVEVDIQNPYTKVMPSYAGMHSTLDKGVWEENGVKKSNYKVEIMSKQAAYAEANGYGNVVAAMNLSLSWYNTGKYLLDENAHLVGEPLAYVVMDGKMYVNSGGQSSGAQTCLVINYDEKDGVARPSSIPKTEIRATSSAITGWEEQVIPANFGFLVKDGKNQYKQDHNAANGASRSFVGIKADGDIVMVMNDGRQSPYSEGFSNYEMAELMIELGCVHAVNGDGGGSSAFLSQRPGEELKINCSPSDGAERPTTHGILVISGAPADGTFAQAQITAENDYYTPNSTITFSALGTDLVGTKVDIPDNVAWKLKDESMGTIENGVFTSNGKTGTVTAQLVYKGEVVGEGSAKIVIPTALSFAQSVMTIPYGKEVDLTPVATINDGLNNVVLNPNDIIFNFTNEDLGTLDGFKFTSVSMEEAPEDVTATVTATLKCDTKLVATAEMSLGKGSEVLFDFESEDDLVGWNTGDVNGNDEGFIQELSIATRADGQVHDGEGSLRVHMNPVSATGISNGGYGQLDLYLDEYVIVENAKSIGFWAYIPDEYEHCWLRVLYWYDSNGDGTYDKKNTVSVINQPEVYEKWDESGWKYFSVDVSAYEKVMIPGVNAKDLIAYNASKNDANNFRFIEFMFPHTNTNDLWKTYGTINGPQTVYIDNITADFSDAVDDREAPVFGTVSLAGNDTGIALKKNSVQTTTSNVLNVTANVSENTAKTNATGLNAASAKAYVDGNPVDCSYSNGRMSIAVTVADGVHRVKFEIADNAGNKSVVVRLIEVKSGVKASNVQLVPKDPTLTSLYGGSLYWMDVKATDIESIQGVAMRIDLNALNHWELAHAEYAPGFTGTYTIDTENNSAEITILRTGANAQTGEAVIASLPIRVLYYGRDIAVPGHDAAKYWNSYGFWPYDLKVDVDKGWFTCVDGYSNPVFGGFSNEEFSVKHELYTAFQDTAFKAERGTAHVHTAEAVEGVPATCTTPGFDGRTYCDVCDSIVAWGNPIAAKGHSFTVTADGVYTCSVCDKTFGYVNGEQVFGWQEINGKVYYFGEGGAAVNGENMIDGVTYKFADFALTAPALVPDGVAYVGWWAGEQLTAGWHTLNGNKYFVTGIYVGVGVTKVALSTNLGYRWYAFDENGVWLENYTGIYNDGDEIVYAVKGVATYAGLVQDADGNYYYFNSGCKAVKNCSYGISESKTNGLVPAGIYKFGADGKMLNPPSDEPEDTKPTEPEQTEPTTPPEVKQGLVFDDDGEIRYYVDGVATYAGVVADEDGNLYYINSSKKAVKNCKYGVSAGRANGLVAAGVYEFGADGKMLNPPADEPEDTKPTEPTETKPTEPEQTEPTTPPEVKQGLHKDEDGEIRFYVDGVATYAGLVKDSEGNLYYINSSKKAVKSCKYGISAARANGLAEAGIYEFGADGKMLNPPTDEEPEDTKPTEPEQTEPTTPPEVKQGLHKDEDGEIRYYVDGVPTYAGVVADEDGNLYYINSSKKAVKNCKYGISAGRANGLVTAGVYFFDADGKMIK